MRRTVLRALFTLAVAAFTGGALAPLVRTGQREGVEAAPPGFDEMYRGRRIQGAGPAGGPLAVYVDGRPLQLMRCADGGWLTPIDHCASYPTPLAATRAAVDELGGAGLSGAAATHGRGPGGGARGGAVHA
ncbi:tyrosinase family oxidase copper chaperone [Streptomyces lichenis]|uniref:tyrosinase family oxidase copper chaperone n=1 Tax=Streptomyces lichenis TaxID=2306967 RepID=UPI0027E38344|nr:tyrosinase family oxidase copper chaperone [Streptomyces lichenis]